MIFNMSCGGSSGSSGAVTGTKLNFSVVAYASETDLLAAKPNNNTIGVITTTSISSYIFSVSQPSSPTAGMVWIATGTSSQVSFSVTEGNLIMVYPISAKQYKNGAWVDVACKTYRNDAWVDWWDGYLYDYGDQNTSITGGWVSTRTGAITFNSKSMSLRSDGNSKVYTKNKINLTDAKALVFNGTLAGDSEPTYRSLAVFSGTPTSDDYSNLVAYYNTTVTNGTCRLDVSKLTGSYHVGFCIRDDTTTVNYLKIEK